MRSQFLEILSQQRLATGKSELKDAEFTSLGEDSFPIISGQLGLGPDQLQRVGAIGAMERTPMGQLRQERGRNVIRHGAVLDPPSGPDTR